MAESQIKQLAKNTVFLYFRMILVLLVTLYTSRVVLRVLGFEDFGIYNLVGSVVVFFVFFKTALTNATYRYLAFAIGERKTDELKKVYSMAINCHIMLAIILFVVMEFIGVWFLNNHLEIPDNRMFAANIVFQFSLLTFCVGIIQTPFHSNIIAHEQMNFYAVVSIVEVVLKLATVYLLSVSPIDKLISYAILLFVVALLVIGTYIIYCRNVFKDTSYIRYWDKKWIIKFSSYSGWSLFVNGADVCTQQAFSVFFNWFVGVVGNAALGLSNQVNSGINMFVANFSQAFNPQIIKSYAAKDYKYFMKLIFTMSKVSYILFVIIAVPIVINIDYVLSVWLGKYPDITPDLVKVTMIFYLFDSFQIPLWQGVHATGNIKNHQIMVGCIKLISVPLAYLAFRINGSPVLAMGLWAAVNFLCSIARTIYVHYLFNLDLLKYFKDVCCRLFVLTVIIVVISSWMSGLFSQNFIGFISTSLIMDVLIVILSIFMVLNKSERNTIKNFPIVKNILKK